MNRKKLPRTGLPMIKKVYGKTAILLLRACYSNPLALVLTQDMNLLVVKMGKMDVSIVAK